MEADEHLFFTNNVKLRMFDINSSEIKTFEKGTSFKIEVVNSNYNDYYKTFIYHIRAYEKLSNSNCIFTCSKDQCSKKITVYLGEVKNDYLDWSALFTETYKLSDVWRLFYRIL